MFHSAAKQPDILVQSRYLRRLNVVKQLGLILLLFLVVSPSEAAPHFEGYLSRESDSGHVLLEWSGGDRGAIFELQSSTDPEFNNHKTIYSGPDQAKFISGLTDGTYYFRVRVKQGAWSPSLILQIKHPPLWLAFLLLAIGASVFICTTLLIWTGLRKHSAIEDVQ